MDAGLAKVINSTVGTDLFRPLDKLLYGRHGLAPSENAYFSVGNLKSTKVTISVGQTKESAVSSESIIKMKMWTDGGFSIGANIRYGINPDVSSGYWELSVVGGIAIYVNGALYKQVYTNDRFGEQSGTTTESLKADNIFFSAGDIIEVKTYITGNRLTSGSTKVGLMCDIDTSKPIVMYANAVEKPFDILRAE